MTVRSNLVTHLRSACARQRAKSTCTHVAFYASSTAQTVHRREPFEGVHFPWTLKQPLPQRLIILGPGERCLAGSAMCKRSVRVLAVCLVQSGIVHTLPTGGVPLPHPSSSVGFLHHFLSLDLRLSTLSNYTDSF